MAASSRQTAVSLRIPRQQFRPAALRHLHSTTIRYEQKANTGAKRDPAPKIVRGESKLFKDADAAVVDLQSGSTILSAGFGLAGTAGQLYPT
jgi:3-oxoacid CoA-transferase